jgi:hypothetical protein
MDAERHCVGCLAYDIVELEDGRWSLVCENHPDDRVVFDTRPRLLSWIDTMMEHEKGPWHVHVTREGDETLCAIDHSDTIEVPSPS